jgi:hypothetical protein
MAGLLASAGVRTETLSGVAAALNGGARTVHETFATTTSSGIFGIDTGRRLLANNPRYLEYLESGLALGGGGDWPWQFRESAIQMLLRTLMQPAQVVDLAGTGFADLRLRDLPDDTAQPDHRLRRIRNEAAQWWEEAFYEIAAEHPDRGGDTGGQWARSLPDDPDAMNAMKLWEEQILIPRLQQAAERHLSAAGYTILDGGTYLEAVAALQASFLDVGPDDWRVEVLTGPRRLEDEPLGAEREALQFHDAAFPVRIIELDDIVDNASLFLNHSPNGRALVCSLYALPEVFRHQFAGMDWLPIDRPPLLALLGQLHAADSGPEVPLAMLSPSVTPHELKAMFTSLPVLTLTTLSTTREPEYRDSILELDRSFIVIDLPLRLQIEQWANTGWRILFRVTELQSDRPLTLVVFAIDELPQCLFLAFRSQAGYSELAQLLDRYGDHLHPGLETDEDTADQVNAAAVQLLNSWWTFRETGWTR